MFFIDREIGLMMVADGMGGHNAGDLASRLASQLFSEQMKRALQTGIVPIGRHVPFNPDMDRRTLLMGDCIKFSNQAIYEAGQSQEQSKHMGTTMVAALWLDDKIGVAHVGDSRLYIIRDGDIVQCTNDHSFIQEQMDRGFMKPEEAEKSELRNMLTRSVGVKDDVDVDLKEVPVITGDFILLCSDGLNKMLTDEQIAMAFLDQQDPQMIVDELIKKANEAGGLDNITAIVARVEGHKLADKVKDLFRFNRLGAEGN